MARTIVDDSAGWVVVIRRQIWAGNSTTTGLPGAYRTGCISVSRAQDASRTGPSLVRRVDRSLRVELPPVSWTMMRTTPMS